MSEATSTSITFPFEVKTVDSETGTFKGKASVFGKLDSYKDKVAKGAFKKSLEEKGVGGIALLWQHMASQPIGVWDSIVETTKALNVEGRLALGIQKGREAHELLKMKALNGLSIGFVTKASELDEETGIRTLTEIDLWEVSLVTFPALSSARITGVKSVAPFTQLPIAPLETPWSEREARERLMEFTDAADGPNEEFRRAYLWCEEGRQDSFEAHKLLICDVLDGTLVIVPRAVQAAAAQVLGVTGDLGIPPEELLQVRALLERYYTSMSTLSVSLRPPWNCESPFKVALSSLSVLLKTERDFEAFLRDAGWSRKEAEAIVARGFKSTKEQGDPVLIKRFLESVRSTTRAIQNH